VSEWIRYEICFRRPRHGPPVTQPPRWRPALGEALGIGLLVPVVVGSGNAATPVSPGDLGLQLFENSFATALGLAVLILILGMNGRPLVLSDSTRVLGRDTLSTLVIPSVYG
jgi:hypothetical protein